MASLSEHGGFAEWLRELQIVFRVNSIDTGEEIATLRIVPTGYECDGAYFLYGIYVDMYLECSGTSITPGGDFLDTNQLRQLARFISAPTTNADRAKLSGELFELEFGWQDDGRLRMDGVFGQEGWGREYLEKLFKARPFRMEDRFKSSLSVESLTSTRTEIARLLRLVADVEAGKPPSLPKIEGS